MPVATTRVLFIVGDVENGDVLQFDALEAAKVAYQNMAADNAATAATLNEAEQAAADADPHYEQYEFNDDEALLLSQRFHFLAKRTFGFDEDGDQVSEVDELLEGGTYNQNISAYDNL